MAHDPDFVDLTRTRDALRNRDQRVPALWAQIEATNSQGKMAELLDEVNAIEESVGEAFGLDTADRNNFETCRQCVRAGEPGIAPGETQPSWLRRQVAAFEAGK